MPLGSPISRPPGQPRSRRREHTQHVRASVPFPLASGVRTVHPWVTCMRDREMTSCFCFPSRFCRGQDRGGPWGDAKGVKGRQNSSSKKRP